MEKKNLLLVNIYSGEITQTCNGSVYKCMLEILSWLRVMITGKLITFENVILFIYFFCKLYQDFLDFNFIWNSFISNLIWNENDEHCRKHNALKLGNRGQRAFQQSFTDHLLQLLARIGANIRMIYHIYSFRCSLMSTVSSKRC